MKLGPANLTKYVNIEYRLPRHGLTYPYGSSWRHEPDTAVSVLLHPPLNDKPRLQYMYTLYIEPEGAAISLRSRL